MEDNEKTEQDCEVQYEYDELGNMIALTYPGGEIVRYEYYNDGQIRKMTSNSGGTIYEWNYAYDAYGRLAEIKRPDGTKETREYNNDGTLKSQKEIKGTVVISNATYSYNVFGEVIQKTTSQSGDVDKLTTIHMEYDDANRLIKWGNETVQYDDKGNMTYGPVNGIMQTLDYDCRNRLIQAGGVTYTYDAENTRISSTENGTTTEYVADTSGSLSQLLIAYESAGSTTTYYYGAEGLAGQYNNGSKERLFYHFDNIGSTTFLTNLAGEIVERYAYGTYGELLSTVEKCIRFLYNGAYGVTTDSNGLYYMRARYYNPDIKRFINQDIKVGDISNGQGLNRYAYCEGNPISMVDPFGLCGEQAQDVSDGNRVSKAVHAILDVVGFVVDGADILNAVIYAIENKPTEAVLCGMAVIPAVGSYIAAVSKAGKAFKATKTTTRLLGIVTDSGKLLSKADEAADVTGDIMRAVSKGGDTPQKLVKEVASGGNTKVVKTLEAGSDARDAKKAVDSMVAVNSPNGVKVATSADEAADALKVTDDVVEGGNHSRGLLSDYLGKPVNVQNGRFYSIMNESGGQVFVSTENIVQSDIAKIVSVTDGNINIISGRHGDWLDNIRLEPEFYMQDMKRFGDMDNVNVFNYSDINSNQIENLINSSDTTILGWCFSEYSSFMRDVFK